MWTDRDIQHRLIVMCRIVEHTDFLARDSNHMFHYSEAYFDFVNRNSFLSRVRESLWKLSLIELSKVIGSRNDDFSLFQLLCRLRDDYQQGNWKNRITIERINELIEALGESKDQRKTKLLRELRNQHLAHTDLEPKNHIHSIGFYYQDFQLLVLNAKKVLSELLTTLTFDTYPFNEYELQDFENAFRLGS